MPRTRASICRRWIASSAQTHSTILSSAPCFAARFRQAVRECLTGLTASAMTECPGQQVLVRSATATSGGDAGWLFRERRLATSPPRSDRPKTTASTGRGTRPSASGFYRSRAGRCRTMSCMVVGTVHRLRRAYVVPRFHPGACALIASACTAPASSACQRRINHAVALDPALPFERRRTI